MKILIIGARGLLGSFLYSKLKKKFKIYRSSRYKLKNFFQLDLNNPHSIKKILESYSFDAIINTSGLVDVEKCNRNMNLAKKFNSQTVKKLSMVLNEIKQKPHLIHFSTDQVYNNKNPKKKNKENNVKVTNNYSKSKYLGELNAHNYKKRTILRTNFFGNRINSNKLSYSDYIINNLKKKKLTKVPINIYFSPINMTFIANILSKIISKKIYGTYNLGSNTGISKYEFCKKVAQIKKLSIKPLLPYFSYIKKNKRPNGTIMDVKKLERKLKIKLPTINKSLQMLSK